MSFKLPWITTWSVFTKPVSYTTPYKTLQICNFYFSPPRYSHVKQFSDNFKLKINNRVAKTFLHSTLWYQICLHFTFVTTKIFPLTKCTVFLCYYIKIKALRVFTNHKKNKLKLLQQKLIHITSARILTLLYLKNKLRCSQHGGTWH